MGIHSVIEAMLYSYGYNRSARYMIGLCKEIKNRIRGCSCYHTDDGDNIYGTLVMLCGEYGTSPRSGWLVDSEEIDVIIKCINDVISTFLDMERQEEEK